MPARAAGGGGSSRGAWRSVVADREGPVRPDEGPRAAPVGPRPDPGGAEKRGEERGGVSGREDGGPEPGEGVG